MEMSKKRALVFIDPGHGGKDPGAVGSGGARESDVTLLVAHLLKSRLEKNFDVQLTRYRDEFVDLDRRCRLANEARANLFISIHCNASKDSSAHGLEVWCHSRSESGADIASMIHDALISKLRLVGRGVKKTDRLAVLNGTKMTAILVELAFISNPEEEMKLGETQFLCDAADSMAEVITNLFMKG